MNSHLDYSKFYVLQPEDEALSIVNKEYGSIGKDNLHAIKDSLPELRMNIVLVMMESMSASFLGRYGNTESITPNIDKLIDESLVLTTSMQRVTELCEG